MILEVMEVKWRSKRGRIDTAMAYSENMGKNRVVCKKDPQLVENCDREPPPTLKVPQWNAPFLIFLFLQVHFHASFNLNT